MVFFTCNHCGESVKKPAVEKHYNTKCRGAVKNVSCMDCLKDFRDEEYAAHTKCITEAQKYSGKDYVAKESKNSGAKKQESWMDIIRSILDSSEYKLSAQARSAFQRLQSVDNVPRKKAKFQNFVSNCMRMPKALSEEVWNVLEKEQEKMKQARQQEAATNGIKQQQNGKQENGIKREASAENVEDEPKKKKTKKVKVAENGDALATAEESASSAATKKSKKQKLADNNTEVEATIAQKEQDEPAKKKSKKQKAAAIAESGEQVVPLTADNSLNESITAADDEFQWSAVLEKLVAKHIEGITLDKLKKRLLKKYLAKLDVESLTEKQQKKFEKKFARNLKKSPAIEVDGEVAKPC